MVRGNGLVADRWVTKMDKSYSEKLRSSPNQLTWLETTYSYEQGLLVFYVNRSLAIQAVRSGIKTSAIGLLTAIAVPICFVGGVVLALLLSWWWLPIGILLAVMFFYLSRESAVRAVRRAALSNEELFQYLRNRKYIWFEKKAL